MRQLVPRAMLPVKVLPTRFAVSRDAISRASERSRMRLLLTRPRDDAEPLAHTLEHLGHEAVIAPLMQIRPLPVTQIPLARVQALLATSANGIRAFAAQSAVRNLPVYAVGPQTAEAAKARGFREIISANGDSAALAATVIEQADPANGPLLHAAGADTAGRLSETLQDAGFEVEVVVLYQAVAMEQLPSEAAAGLRRDTLDGVVLFSPRSAAVFAALTMKAGLSGHCRRLAAFCISDATAIGLSPLRFARVTIATSPNHQSILDLIGSADERQG